MPHFRKYKQKSHFLAHRCEPVYLTRDPAGPKGFSAFSCLELISPPTQRGARPVSDKSLSMEGPRKCSTLQGLGEFRPGSLGLTYTRCYI